MLLANGLYSIALLRIFAIYCAFNFGLYILAYEKRPRRDEWFGTYVSTTGSL